ncbi:MAG TPA: lysine-2,3-aminomutase-like protein [Rhizomicrobium sp.]|jgi:lysine 2,3-aminomutase|nr:lysine-2,3-aminomutase-like protein [Rhizomicrobium sp.]
MTLALVAQKYAVAISPTLEALIDSTDLSDPIARQFLPDIAELIETAAERFDPIGDGAHETAPGIIHRHRDRVLFKAVSSCPVYCRFCFRREQIGPGKANHLSSEDFERAFGYVQDHPEIYEVILTGGDPFILSPRRAKQITRRLAAIGHVKIVRWHTRVPMVDPERVSDDFVAALMAPDVTSWVAIHANHPREFSPQAKRALARLADAGIPLVSQTVLLRGVNDTVETLIALMKAFVENRVKPYYLHHPDLARGTSHFRLGIDEGLALTRALRGGLSGLAQPTYVLDIPGGFGKVPLDSANVEKTAVGYRIRDFSGVWHNYIAG